MNDQSISTAGKDTVAFFQKVKAWYENFEIGVANFWVSTFPELMGRLGAEIGKAIEEYIYKDE